MSEGQRGATQAAGRPDGAPGVSLARLLGLGILAALFFSSTFVLNRAMSLQGGHWVWSAALRYGYMLCFILLGFLVSGRAPMLGRVWREYVTHWLFWTVAGGIGFGVFYTGITAAAAWAPGWVVATTWQLTILATPVVLLAFGRRVPLRGVLFALLIFVGILLVNAEQAAETDGRALLLGVLPVLVAAFAYPAGMQLVWEARNRSLTGSGVGSRLRFKGIPHADPAVLDQPFARVLLLVIGSVPWWVGLWAVVRPPAPSAGQWLNTALVALLSGIVATVLFMQARHLSRSPYQLAAVDSTQAAEVLFSLAGELVLLGGVLPGRLGVWGIGLTIGGLVLYLLAQGRGGAPEAKRKEQQAVATPRGQVDMRWYTLGDTLGK